MTDAAREPALNPGAAARTALWPRFLWAIKPLASLVAALSLASCVGFCGTMVWHDHKARVRATDVRDRLRVGMTLDEVQSAVGDLGTVVHRESAEPPQEAYVHVWSGLTGLSVTIHLDAGGRVREVEDPTSLD
jgi:hypothetical protein